MGGRFWADRKIPRSAWADRGRPLRRFRTAGEEEGAAGSSRLARPAEAAAQRQRGRQRRGAFALRALTETGGDAGKGQGGSESFSAELRSVAERRGERRKQGKALSRSPTGTAGAGGNVSSDPPCEEKGRRCGADPVHAESRCSIPARMTRTDAALRRGMPRHEKKGPGGFGRPCPGVNGREMGADHLFSPAAGRSRHDRRAVRFPFSAKRRASRRTRHSRPQKRHTQEAGHTSFPREKSTAYA